MRIYAVSHDPYWLDTLKKIEVRAASIEVTPCPGELLECLENLPEGQANGLIILDASGYIDIKPVVQMLRESGWRYVIVVTADTSARKAIAILRRNLAYDYWAKTYDIPPTQRRIEHSLQEIKKARRKRRARKSQLTPWNSDLKHKKNDPHKNPSGRCRS